MVITQVKVEQVMAVDKELQGTGDNGRRPQGGGRRKGEGRGESEWGGERREMGENKRAEKCTVGAPISRPEQTVSIHVR